MSKKKSLKEVFEFFPNAKWITQDKGKNGMINIHMTEPWQEPMFGTHSHWESDINTMSNIDQSILQIDWGKIRTWDKKFVSREGVLNDK